MSRATDWLELLHKKYYTIPSDRQWFIDNCKVILIFSKFSCRITVQEMNGNFTYVARKQGKELDIFIEKNKGLIEEKLR